MLELKFISSELLIRDYASGVTIRRCKMNNSKKNQGMSFGRNGVYCVIVLNVKHIITFLSLPERN